MSNQNLLEAKPRRREPPIVAGRVPPHDLEAEAAVLSALLLKPETLDDVSGLLRPENFYSPANGSIFEAVTALTRTGRPIDAVEVATWLRNRERLGSIGGPAYIAQIVDATPAVHNVVSHAQTVAIKARRRQVIAEAQTIAAEGYGDVGDELEWIEQAEQRMAKLGEGSETKSLVTIGDALKRYWELYQAEITGKVPASGGCFGIQGVDDILGPLKMRRVTLVGGFPGDGKSALGLQAAIATVREPRQDPSAALYISAEMGEDELAMRALFSEAEVDSSKARPFRHKDITHGEWQKLHAAGADLTTRPLFIDDRANVSIADLAPTVRRHKAKAARHGLVLRLVVVDYLQLVDGRAGLSKGANREQEVSNVAVGLKRLAKACDVHVLALAQLNDDASKRGKENNRPTSRDFRESKAIWANADNCILIHNPEARERSKARRSGEKARFSTDPESCELIIDKQRGGTTGTVDCHFYPHLTRFADAGPSRLGDYDL